MIFHILFNISYVENHFLFLREYMFDSGSKLGINKIILALSLYYDVKFNGFLFLQPNEWVQRCENSKEHKAIIAFRRIVNL